MIIERIRSGLKKRKVKVFLIILLFSTLAWFINNLSQSYNSTTSFELEYVNTPKELLLSSEPKKTIEVKLRALGFQFLGFELRKRKVSIDMSKVLLKDSVYYISPEVYQSQIERQLPNSMTLLEMEKDTLFFDFTTLITKELPVIPRINISLGTNYMMDDSIAVNPPNIKVTGPKKDIDTITGIRTAYLDLEDIEQDFSRDVALIKSKSLETTSFSVKKVTISGTVFRFSEKIVKVPVDVVNLPDDVQVRTFPDSVQVVCQGKLEDIKDLESDDFEVVADYENVSGDENNMLPIQLKDYPKSINNARLLTDEIEFILRRE